MKKLVSLFVLAALPLCSQIALAGPVANSAVIETLANGVPQGLSCSSCTASQMQSLAASKGKGTWYVYNLPAATINQYVVSCEPIAGGYSCYADLGTVPTAINNWFNTYYGLWLGNGKRESFSAAATVTVLSPGVGGPVNAQGNHVDDGYTNAYDTLVSSSQNNFVISLLNNPSTYSGAYATLVGLLAPTDVPVIKVDKIQAVVVVTFHDKSHRTYQFDKILDTYAPVANTAVDSAGNTIPESKPRNGAQFTGDPAHPYNIPNIITILNADPPTFKDVDCLEEVWTDDPKMSGGGTLTCVKSP